MILPLTCHDTGGHHARHPAPRRRRSTGCRTARRAARHRGRSGARPAEPRPAAGAARGDQRSGLGRRGLAVHVPEPQPVLGSPRRLRQAQHPEPRRAPGPLRVRLRHRGAPADRMAGLPPEGPGQGRGPGLGRAERRREEGAVGRVPEGVHRHRAEPGQGRHLREAPGPALRIHRARVPVQQGAARHRRQTAGRLLLRRRGREPPGRHRGEVRTSRWTTTRLACTRR